MRVRARLALRHVLTGAAVGLVLGAGAAGALWRTRHGGRGEAGVAGGLLGAAVGAAVARRKRWPDADVALYLDARLDAGEVIATALELEGRRDDPAGAVVLSHATAALTHATPAAVRARLLRPQHAALPVAAAAIGLISLAPVPPLPPGLGAPPGAETVRLAQLTGLDKIRALASAHARDEAQRERLRKLADEANKLREKLRAGVEKREAQAEIAKLKDGITAERLSLGEGEQRQGMESALGKLGENPDLKSAQRALGDRDLVRLDEAMERLADTLEKADRAHALRTLEEAAEAAGKAGAPDVARALEAERKRLAERGQKLDRLRELGRELSDALGELTPEQRRQLAENLKKQMEDAPDQETDRGPSKRELAELADRLSTPEGRRQLAEELKRMAEAPAPDSDEAERQRSLDDAEDGADDAEKQLGGGTPMPVPVPGAPGNGGPLGPSGEGAPWPATPKARGRGATTGRPARSTATRCAPAPPPG